MKKRAVICIIIFAIFVIFLSVTASNPVIVCKYDIPDNYTIAIENQAKGVFSKKLPLIPVYIVVNGFEGESVYYTIHYFPFGTVDMSYRESDGYNMEKPLTPL